MQNPMITHTTTRFAPQNKRTPARDTDAFRGPQTLNQLRAMLALMSAGELCEQDSQFITPGESLNEVLRQLHSLNFTLSDRRNSMRHCVGRQWRRDGSDYAGFHFELTTVGQGVLLEAIANRARPLPFPMLGCVTFADAVHQMDRVLGSEAAIRIRGLRALRAELEMRRRSPL